MQIRGTPGSYYSQWAEVPSDFIGVWVRSLILKACWDERRFAVIRRVVSEGELSAMDVDQSLFGKRSWW